MASFADLNYARVQEEPLDLTTKKEKSSKSKTHQQETTMNKTTVDSFNFPRFYDTYLSISSRQSLYSPHFTTETVENLSKNENKQMKHGQLKKRKHTDDFSLKNEHSRLTKKARRVTVVEKETIREKVKSRGVWSPSQQTSSSVPEKKHGRKSRKLVNSAIASINRLCDCRSCYEQHILKMRAGTWLGLA